MGRLCSDPGVGAQKDGDSQGGFGGQCEGSCFWTGNYSRLVGVVFGFCFSGFFPSPLFENSVVLAMC